jgi:hypothetical protein
MRVSHSMSRLIWLADLAWLIERRRDQIEWDRIEHNAKHWGVDRLVYPVLVFVQSRFEAAIPPSFLDALRPARPSWGERLFSRCLARSIRQPGLSYVVHLASRPGMAAKARFLAGTLSPPGAILAQRFRGSPRPSGRLSRLFEVIGHLSRLLRPRLLQR